jgi:O-antigen/teichoic acid export membrane protein
VITIAAAGAMAMTLVLTSSLFIILFVYFFSYTMLRAFFLMRSLKRLDPQKLKQDPEALRYGKHLSLVSILSTLSANLDKILLFQSLGAVQLAIYTFANAPVQQVKGLSKGIPTLVVPKIANKTIEEIGQTIKKRLVFLFLLGLTLSFVYIALAPFFFRLVFPRYLDAILFSQILSLSMAVILPQMFLQSIRYAKLTSIPLRIHYKLQIFSNSSSILLLLLLGIPFGLMGVTIARVIGSVIVFFIYLFYWNRVLSLQKPVQLSE